ncbi:hypothetical protein KYC5002_00265 [Archangium violaceum]|uniref:hypothetical protein n=1 Tax=Archangium violaceum TaxID=83451 RepID=UPI002B3076E3|nr:hypothetical protein KYC5002_00265 [Archangium gephyra]
MLIAREHAPPQSGTREQSEHDPGEAQGRDIHGRRHLKPGASACSAQAHQSSQSNVLRRPGSPPAREWSPIGKHCPGHGALDADSGHVRALADWKAARRVLRLEDRMGLLDGP